MNINASQITSGIINPHRLPAGYDGGGGGDGGGHFIHTQSTPAATWIIEHALGFYPSVTVVDSAGDECVGDVNYPSITTVVVTFSGGFSGAAYLS